MHILSLPDCVLEIILSYLSYDDIAKSRVVCRKFNEINKQALNHGFYKLLSYHSKHMKRIKAMLPRRESERRNHHLAKHSDVLTCIETRLSMLSMTYQKHIQSGLVCFIPGKIIDECYKVIRSITNSNDEEIRNLRAHEILQELRDISSMAIDHFDEKIAVDFTKNSIEAFATIPLAFDMFPSTSNDDLCSSSRNTSSTSTSSSSNTPAIEPPIIRTVRKKPKMTNLMSLYKKQSKIIAAQSKKISKMMKFMKEQKSSLNTLKRRLDESEVKNLELSERNHYLAKHSDVLTCIETRLSMLSMTYQKHMQNGSSCFIPGKIIDECYKILRSISNSNDQQIKNLRAHEILQELRDISSMAIEHFDEKIAVDLKKNRVEPLTAVPSVFDMFPRGSIDGLFSMSRNTSCTSISTPTTPDRDFSSFSRTSRKKSKMSTLVSLYKKQSKVIKNQSKQIYKMMKFMKDQKTTMSSMKRRLDESEVKNRELSESIKKVEAKKARTS
ncbi:unnamed protein product [Chironomus riparius]|uniref:F-box domain-containing protein n=1 Tax=Chironomus riparius TaxID=315576 RepID=A0A9N9WW02_9DIPT|nr:unnamed protein product [Chironomus riparius]